jgi:hypothetical protein
MSDGTEILEYRKNWTGDKLKDVMSDYLKKESSVVNTSDVVEETTEELSTEEI